MIETFIIPKKLNRCAPLNANVRDAELLKKCHVNLEIQSIPETTPPPLQKKQNKISGNVLKATVRYNSRHYCKQFFQHW